MSTERVSRQTPSNWACTMRQSFVPCNNYDTMNEVNYPAVFPMGTVERTDLAIEMLLTARGAIYETYSRSAW